MNRRVSKRLHDQAIFLIKDIKQDREKALAQILRTLKRDYKDRNKSKQKPINKILVLADKRRERRRLKRQRMLENGMKRKNGGNWKWFKYKAIKRS